MLTAEATNRYRNCRKMLFRRIFQRLVLTATKYLRHLKLRQQKVLNCGINHRNLLYFYIYFLNMCSKDTC
jgi:hypothetical protein